MIYCLLPFFFFLYDTKYCSWIRPPLEQSFFIGKIEKILREVKMDRNFSPFFTPIQRGALGSYTTDFKCALCLWC
jgi:hypothetical protein